MGVNIRINRGKIFLDIYHNGIRKWEFTGLKVSTDKQMQREVMNLAEVCRAKRELQIISGEWGLIDSISGKQTLNQYIETMSRGSPGVITKALNFLKAHNRGNIALSAITEKWLAGTR